MIFFGLIQMIFFDNNFLSGVETITFESEIEGGGRGGGWNSRGGWKNSEKLINGERGGGVGNLE